MYRLIVICTSIVAVIIALESTIYRHNIQFQCYRSLYSTAGFRLEPLGFDKPVSLQRKAGDVIDLKVETAGWHVTGVVEIVGRGGRASIKNPDYTIVSELGPTSADCVPLSENGWKCRALWPTEGSTEQYAKLYPSDDSLVISSVEFSVVSLKRSSPVTLPSLVVFIWAQLLTAPLIVFLKRLSQHMELLALTGMSTAWIIGMELSGACTIALFLVTGYALIRLELADVPTKLPTVALTCGLAVLFPVYFKIAPSPTFGIPLLLPLGLSYFCVRLVDLIFAARARTIRDIGVFEYCGFMLHPSMLAAGPLATLTEFRRARIEKWSIVDYGSGVARCLLGLAKKLVADVFLSRIVAKYVHLTVLHPETANFHVVWPMLFGQMLYIYLDFTGYTDMAVGAGRALGWRIPENFNWPLIRSNLLRFWQSWHMTLSNWVMRRVYFPAFVSSRAPIVSSTCAMLVIGIWHEPNFGWAAWAIHHGFGLGVTRTFLNVAFGKDRVLTLVSNHWLGRFLIGFAGWLLTMSWVALSMSYTLFDNYFLSLQTLRYAFRS